MTDLNTGLQWELKTYEPVPVFPNPHGVEACGTAFVVFLGTLDAGISFDGVGTRECFADKCDWRLPTVEELRMILAAQYPNCPVAEPATPCTTIPGFTNGYPTTPGYWISTTDEHDPTKAWMVSFRDGTVSSQPKGYSGSVRAVRGEM